MTLLLALLLALAAPAAAQVVELDVEIIEGNALRLTMGPFVDVATQEPATPTWVTYRLDAPVRRQATALLAPVTVEPDSPTIVVVIPCSAVQMYSDDVDRQEVELTVDWESPSGHRSRAIARLTVERARFGGM